MAFYKSVYYYPQIMLNRSPDLPVRWAIIAGLSSPPKNIVSHCCGVRSKNQYGISATAADSGTAPDWPVVH